MDLQPLIDYLTINPPQGQYMEWGLSAQDIPDVCKIVRATGGDPRVFLANLARPRCRLEAYPATVAVVRHMINAAQSKHQCETCFDTYKTLKFGVGCCESPNCTDIAKVATQPCVCSAHP